MDTLILHPRLRFTIFFFFWHAFQEFHVLLRLLFINNSCNFWLFSYEQCIHALFTDSQTSLFNHFFIKNGSHGTIHTFKNYFATMFSVFNFRSNLSNFQLFTRDEILGNTIWKLWWNFLAFKFLCKSKEPSNLIETFLVFLMETFLVGINLLYCKL